MKTQFKRELKRTQKYIVNYATIIFIAVFFIIGRKIKESNCNNITLGEL